MRLQELYATLGDNRPARISRFIRPLFPSSVTGQLGDALVEGQNIQLSHEDVFSKLLDYLLPIERANFQSQL